MTMNHHATRSPRPKRRGGESGHASVLLIGFLILVGAVVAALIDLGVATADRARSQAVADLTALAAVHGDDAARAVATANGGALVGLERRGDTVSITIEHRGATTAARAEPDPRSGDRRSAGPGG